MIDTDRHLERALGIAFAAFVVSSAVSIAFTQFFLGVSLGLYVVICVRSGTSSFARPYRTMYLLVATLFAWEVLSALANPNTVESLLTLRDVWLFTAVPIGVHVLGDSRPTRTLLALFAAAVLLIGAYGVIQYPTGLAIAKHHGIQPLPLYGFRAQGAFSAPLTYGNFMAVAAVFLGFFAARSSLDRTLRGLCLAAAVAAAAGVVFSFGRTPVIGLAVAAVILGITTRRPWNLVAVGVVLVAVCLAAFYLPDMGLRFKTRLSVRELLHHPAERPYIWGHSLQIVAAHPLLGVGPNNFTDAYVETLPANLIPDRVVPHAHNDILHMAATSGIPAALLFVAVWFMVLRLMWRGARRLAPGSLERALALSALAASLVFLFTSLTEATFFDEEVRQLLMFIWAAGLYAFARTGNPDPAATVKSLDKR